MKKSIFKYCRTFILALAAAGAAAFPAMAADIQGGITNVGSQAVTGWAWNPEDTNDVQEVEIHIFQAGEPLPVKYLHTTASIYRDELVEKLQDGWHGFSASINWSDLSGSDFKIKAYAIKDEKYYLLGDTMSYSKSSGSSGKSSSNSSNSGKSSSSSSGSSGSVSVGVAPSGSSSAVGSSSSSSALMPLGSSDSVSRGTEKSLGTFSISGYCSCVACSSGWGLTYSGTVPQPNHTIAADLNLLPLGTKVRIGDTIYTVEDKGSSIVGHMIDIYYADHESAAAQGRVEQEVFLIQ